MGLASFVAILESKSPDTWKENTLDPEKYGNRKLSQLCILLHEKKMPRYSSFKLKITTVTMSQTAPPLTLPWNLTETAEDDSNFCTTLLYSYSCWNQLLKTGWLETHMDLFTWNYRGHKSKIRCQQGHIPCKGSRGEYVPLPFHGSKVLFLVFISGLLVTSSNFKASSIV